MRLSPLQTIKECDAFLAQFRGDFFLKTSVANNIFTVLFSNFKFRSRIVFKFFQTKNCFQKKISKTVELFSN